MGKSIGGHEYEYLCAEKLKKYGFSRVRVTRGSGDQGIDIIAYKNGEKYGIQCKYYSGSVGNAAVQEAYAGAKFYDCQRAAVMTNSYFTQSAKDLAKTTGVLLWGNDRIPFSAGGSKIIKWLGIAMMALGFLAMIAIGTIERPFHPILQRIYMIFLIIGGFFNLCEYGQYAMDLIASMCYGIAAIICAIVNLLSNGVVSSGIYFIIAGCVISLLRTIKLFVKMKNGSEQDFDYDNYT